MDRKEGELTTSVTLSGAQTPLNVPRAGSPLLVVRVRPQTDRVRSPLTQSSTTPPSKSPLAPCPTPASTSTKATSPLTQDSTPPSSSITRNWVRRCGVPVGGRGSISSKGILTLKQLEFDARAAVAGGDEDTIVRLLQPLPPCTAPLLLAVLIRARDAGVYEESQTVAWHFLKLYGVASPCAMKLDDVLCARTSGLGSVWNLPLCDPPVDDDGSRPALERVLQRTGRAHGSADIPARHEDNNEALSRLLIDAILIDQQRNSSGRYSAESRVA